MRGITLTKQEKVEEGRGLKSGIVSCLHVDGTMRGGRGAYNRNFTVFNVCCSIKENSPILESFGHRCGRFVFHIMKSYKVLSQQKIRGNASQPARGTGERTAPPNVEGTQKSYWRHNPALE